MFSRIGNSSATFFVRNVTFISNSKEYETFVHKYYMNVLFYSLSL